MHTHTALALCKPVFDECDEGTAIFKIAATASQVPPPQGSPPCVAFVTADEDGLPLPSDWYLRLVGAITRLHRDPDLLKSMSGRVLPVECSPAVEGALVRRQAEQDGAAEQASRSVRQVYREVLWREADPGGLAHYCDKILSQNASVEDVRRWIEQSEERATLMDKLRSLARGAPRPPPSALPQILPRPIQARRPCAVQAKAGGDGGTRGSGGVKEESGHFIFRASTLVVVCALEHEGEGEGRSDGEERRGQAEDKVEGGVEAGWGEGHIALHSLDLSLMDVAEVIAQFLGLAAPARANSKDEHAGKAAEPAVWILLTDDTAWEWGREGYELTVETDAVTIVVNSPVAALWAFQSLRQLLPVGAEAGCDAVADLQRSGELVVPVCSVKDRPSFPWRGSMLDVARHFMPKDMIFRHIEALSLLKLNVLHLHLTDDQGWRIPVESFPELQGSGWRSACGGRSPGGEGGDGERGELEGGIYSRDDLTEIVEHARRWGVTVVPEIELPGHCNAALAAYPKLSCTGGPFCVEARWGVYEDVLCVGREESFAFVEAVLDDVMAVFPSKYVHVGGDEVPVTRWSGCPHCQRRVREEGLRDESDLLAYTIRRVGAFLASHGRCLIGWDEILEGCANNGLLAGGGGGGGGGSEGTRMAAGTIVQCWRGACGSGLPAVVAARQVCSVLPSLPPSLSPSFPPSFPPSLPSPPPVSPLCLCVCLSVFGSLCVRYTHTHQCARVDDMNADGNTQGLRVISSPTDHCYFDFDLSVTDLRKAYEFRPVRYTPVY